MNSQYQFARIVRRGSLVAALLSGAALVGATADGPDFFRVTAVAENDVLNVRIEPDPQATKIGEILPDGTCLRNLGCRGGLTLQESTELSEEQKAKRLKENPRWCKVEYRGVEGWVAGRYLQEGACDTSAVDLAPDLLHLVGVRGRDGESKLQQLGYSFKGGRKKAGRSLTFYEEPETGRCLRVVTREGRYASLGYVDDSGCRSAARASVTAGGETSLSGESGAESFRTVCGVIVGSRISRYLCEATDLKRDEGFERTALRLPDSELQLIWGEGNQVDVQFQGLGAPVPATYSVHEGETDILVDDKTYFYYSDRGLAASEVEHFAP